MINWWAVTFVPAAIATKILTWQKEHKILFVSPPFFFFVFFFFPQS